MFETLFENIFNFITIYLNSPHRLLFVFLSFLIYFAAFSLLSAKFSHRGKSFGYYLMVTLLLASFFTVELIWTPSEYAVEDDGLVAQIQFQEQ